MRHSYTTGVIIGAAVLAMAACQGQPPATNAPVAAPPVAAVDTGDAAITTRVQAKFYADDLVRGRSVDVTTDHGVVTLRGTVASEAARDRAVSLARQADGVRDVRNELTVQTATATPTTAATGADAATGTTGRTDTELEPASITTKIQAQYFASPEVKSWNIDVTSTRDGVVTLEGEIDTAADRAEAVRIARETDGVSRVDDRLHVKGEASATTPKPPAQPDLWLTAKVQSKFFLDDLVKLRNIDVSTQNAVVTLNGTVASEAERRQAIALARNTDGVRQIENQLTVDPKALISNGTREPLKPVPALSRPDPWITMKVQSQYFLDPEVRGHEIDVDTTRGVVLLKGSVETSEQKQQAERIARDTEGVKRVINQLTIEKG